MHDEEVSEDRMEAAQTVIELWEAFLKTRPGFLLKEHTAAVRALSSGGVQARRMLASLCLIPPVLLLLLSLLARSVLLVLLAFIAFIANVGAAVFFWACYRDSPQQDADHLDTLPWLMGRAGVRKRLSGWHLSQDANTALQRRREELDSDPRTRGHGISPRALGIKLGNSHGVDVWVTSERPVYVLAPTRQGKTTRLVIPAIMEAPGAVIATSSRRDIIDATLNARRDGFTTQDRTDCDGGRPNMRGGRVWVFDPAGVLGSDHSLDGYRLRWDPVSSCTDPNTARSMAAALVSSADLSAENQIWAHIGVDIVQALLMAGGVSGKGLDTVYKWSQGMDGINTARLILQRNGDRDAALFAAPLASLAQDKDPRSVSNKLLSVTTAFGALSLPSVREWFKPQPGPAFDMTGFVQSQDTVYLLSPLRSTAGQAEASVAVFANMFLQDARDTVRRLAAQDRYGKLDPPLSMILDEVANTTPWEGLPQLFTAGTGEGIWAWAFAQSKDQMRKSFGEGEEKQMYDNAQKIIMGGASTEATLREISELTGEHDERYREKTWQSPLQGGLIASLGSTMERRETRVALKPNEIRRIPKDRAILITGSDPAAAVELTPFWNRGWVSGTAVDPDAGHRYLHNVESALS
ncbi:type IV secretory system conjugative DNA transfer family protein [Bifidobacterium xylocopae]|uniref:TraD/TraG TraM recognition site domain-containing protein n=1 Tax=Bifidobacterium xylocopae TaxID=2493119 RepID=A0A366KDT6_9BIFI|nr:TraM recognition domain-containing protein [Bifidobacterium xylocopae]RBP98831.1 hypothetical protein CRD59_06995 [Bifidobacterium xylocopae]